nr:IS200/IS605 family transposase [Bacillus cereus]
MAQNLFTKWKCTIIELNGEENHIPIIFDAPPQIHLANIINSLKTIIYRYIRKEFPQELKPFYWKSYFWSRSYMLLITGSTSSEVIRAYIENQGE